MGYGGAIPVTRGPELPVEAEEGFSKPGFRPVRTLSRPAILVIAVGRVELGAEDGDGDGDIGDSPVSPLGATVMAYCPVAVDACGAVLGCGGVCGDDGEVVHVGGDVGIDVEVGLSSMIAAAPSDRVLLLGIVACVVVGVIPVVEGALYKFKRTEPPHISFLLPAHGIEQPLDATSDPTFRLFPQ